MDVKPEYLAIFSEEASDQLREWEECLLALETNPQDREQLNSLFRAIHTLKGSAGFIGFDALQKVAHDLESSLSDVRDGHRAYDPELGDILFHGLDLCRTMIEAFTDSGDVSAAGVAEFLDKLQQVAGEGAQKAKVSVAAQARQERAGGIPAAAAAAPKPAAPAPAPAAPAAPEGPQVSCQLAVSIEGQSREAYLRSFLVKARLERQGRIVTMDPDPEVLRDSNAPFQYTVTIETASAPDTLPALVAIDQVSVFLVPAKEPEREAEPEEAPSAAGMPPGAVARMPPGAAAGMPPGAAAGKESVEQIVHNARPEEVVRVSVQKLDTLLNLVGELVIHNSGFVATTQQLREQYGKTKFIYDLEEKTEALSAITRDLQDGIMKARMLPIASVFNRFRRVVRDLAKAGGKAVTLDVFGEETEIDKKVIDRIGEPLVHLVRNAVDHGLESAEKRLAAGKSAAGTIRLGAYQEGDHICIEVGDDGNGLDRDAILKKALEKGLITREEVPGASAEKIFGFIFLPGFSTARTVSDISGRGVGMDAVKRAVDEMSGSVRVRSKPGAGTTVTITLPLTMAIITAVLVEVSGSTYAIPLSTVREILKTKDSIMNTVGTRRVILLRNEVLALVNLGDALKDGGAAVQRVSKEGLPVVVVDFEGMKIGLEVEKIHGTREVVIKSLSRHYKEVDGLIGASILGNGTIALIVDVETLISLHSHNGNGRGSGRGAGIFDVAALRGTPAEAPVALRPDAAKPQGAAAQPAQTQGAAAQPAQPQPSPKPAATPAVTEAAPTLAVTEAAPTPTDPSIEELARRVTGSGGRLLEEVHNTGAIQASMSLSQFTGREIRVSFPESRLVPLTDVARLMGGEECTVGGIYVGLQGDLGGGVLMILPEANLLAMDDLLHGRVPGTLRDRGGLDLSALSEMGNILASCFINAMADADHLNVSPEVPEISIDMCLPVIDSVLARFNQPGDSILLTDAVIYGEGLDNVVCHQVLFLEPQSLVRLMDS
ncbi:MAG: chemotaxis protein CheW, partial [Spirochaetia bacterium]